MSGVRPSTADHAAGVPSVRADMKAVILEAGRPADTRAGGTFAGMVVARRFEMMTV